MNEGHTPGRYVRRRRQFVVILLIGSALLLVYQLSSSQEVTPEQVQGYRYRDPTLWTRHLDVAIVCCGDRLQQTVILIKSIALFTVSPVFLHIFAEDNLQNQLKAQIKTFPAKYQARIQLQIYDIQYPLPTEAARTEWKGMFRMCATQRLFMPMILKNVDSLMYLDSDTLVLSDLDTVFAALVSFNSSHAVALVPEQEPDVPGWYTNYEIHPRYGKQGLNSGVMLMNLTRLRALPWLERLQRYYDEYKERLFLGDQDLLNVYFHFHPDEVYLLTCEWNFRSDYCNLGRNACRRSESFGVRVLHGNRMVWHNDDMPTFRAVYDTIEKHNMNRPLQPAFGKSMKRHINKSPRGNCTLLSELFTKTALLLSDN